jgi:hypothetical protein
MSGVCMIHVVPGSIVRPANARKRRISPVVAHSGDRLLSEPTAGTQPCRREPLFLPLSRPSRRPDDQWGKAFFPDGAVNLRFLAA